MSSLLRRAHYIPLAIAAGYVLLLGALTIPAVQREFVFLHRIKLPFLEHYDNPERYGLAPFKTRHFRLTTLDGESLGAWHILPHSVYQTISDEFPPSFLPSVPDFENAFLQRPTVIYFHGNALTRAAPHRIKTYTALSTRLDCNVIAIDYRGFGNSTGKPSEEGLLTDGKTAWDYVVSTIERLTLPGEGKEYDPEEMIVLAGQSLGTGVVAGLAGVLADEGIVPRALVLIAPFTSVTDLLTDYWLLSIIPILSPLKMIPRAQSLLQSYLQYPFNSKSALSKTSSPILILHAKDDGTIPSSHSSSLFTSLRVDSQAVTEKKYDGWGTVRSFFRDHDGRGEVTWWEGEHGGHNRLGWAEGSIDLIGRIARLDSF